MSEAATNSDVKADATAGDWIDVAEAARIVCRGQHSVLKLARKGHIRTHRVPTLRPRYYRPDCERFSPAVALNESA